MLTTIRAKLVAISLCAIESLKTPAELEDVCNYLSLINEMELGGKSLAFIGISDELCG